MIRFGAGLADRIGQLGRAHRLFITELSVRLRILRLRIG
jgi:hypothetical protein